MECNLIRGCRPETEAKYRPALELYTATGLLYAEICRQCGVSVNGFARYVGTYHRHLMLQRNGIKCSPAEAGDIKMSQRRGQHPETHAKYKEAIHLYETTPESLKSITRRLGLNDCSLGQFIKCHFPELIERRKQQEQVNQSSIIS